VLGPGPIAPLLKQHPEVGHGVGVAVHAFVWRRGRMTDLGTLGGPTSWAMGINDRGDVVGFSDTSAGDAHAFLWRHGRMIDLGTVEGGTFSLAQAVNNRGEVVGEACQPCGPFVWQRGVMTRLEFLPGTEFGTATAINNRGQIVGILGFPSGVVTNVAVLWDRGRPISLGTLGGTTSHANDINDRGQVVGAAVTANDEGVPFVWRNGTMTVLESLIGPSGVAAAAFAINNQGQVVGESQTALGPEPFTVHAVLWR
jgi:probable HAF family extracellular repeat protein